MVRTPYCEKTGLKKGAWTPEEDKKLVAYIKRYGLWNWRELPKYAGRLTFAESSQGLHISPDDYGLSRCGKSCRLRWMNYLRPNIRRGNYSKEEEDVIISMHQELGNKWAAIAAKLPGRTDNEIKNHWHTSLKKRVKQIRMASEPKPHTCQSGSEYKDNSKQEPEPSSLLLDIPSLQTLENTPVSPVPSLSSISSSSTDSMGATSTNWMGDDFTASWDKFAEPISGDFWTEPYVAGNSCIQEIFPETWAYPEILFPLSPFSMEESLCTYGPCEDNYMEWFN